MLDSMTRDLLKRAIDARVRALIANDGEPRCSGCGMHYDEETPHCPQCWDRHRNRRARQALAAGEPYTGTHGTRGYSIGCKCDVCIAAGRAQRRNKRHALQQA